MSGRPRHFLALLLLLVFTGQVLAAPFLCCHQDTQSDAQSKATSGIESEAAAMQGHGEDCHSMPMAAMKQGGSGDEPMSVETPADHHLSGSFMSDCDHLCLQCPAGAAMQASQVAVDPAPVLVSAGEYFTPPSHPDGLFRPPKAA